MAGRYERDGWTFPVRPSSSVPALGSAGVFFIVANVNAAVWTSGDLSFWGFVLMGAMAGASAVFVGVFLACKAAIQAVRRLPVSIPIENRRWIGGALVGLSTLVGWAVTLVLCHALELWLYLLPSVLTAAIAAGLGFVFALRAVTEEPTRPGRANMWSDGDFWR